MTTYLWPLAPYQSQDCITLQVVTKAKEAENPHQYSSSVKCVKYMQPYALIWLIMQIKSMIEAGTGSQSGKGKIGSDVQ